MRRVHISLLVLALLILAVPSSARRVIPPTIELDGCILPSTTCDPKADVVTLTVDGDKRKFAVEELRFASSPAGSTGKLLSELKFRGLRVSGPKELTSKLEGGARQRVRGVLRLEAYYLLLQSVEPLAERR